MTALAVGVLLWSCWVWIQLLRLAYLRPPLFWDSLVYHIPAIHHWVLRGRVEFVDSVPDVPFVAYPMGVEVSGFLVHQLTQTTRLVDASNLWYWPLAVSGLAVIAARLGARGLWRWVAGALLFGAPTFIGQGATAYVDAGFASTVIASLAAVSVLVSPDPGRLWWKGALLGVTLGLMLGSKGTGPLFVVVFAVGLMAFLLAVNWVDRARALAVPLLLCGLLALAVGGYWYARNAAVTGSPTYPIGLRLGSKVITSGLGSGLVEQVPRASAGYPEWAWTFLAWLQPEAPVHGPYSIGGGGLGYIWIVGGLPAVAYLWVLALSGRRRQALRVLALVTLIVVLLMAVQPAAWESRYSLWLHALGLPCLAAVISDAIDRWRSRRRHLLTVGLGVAALALGVWESQRTLRLEWATGRDPERGPGPVFRSTPQVWFPGLEEAPGFSELLGAKILARGHWRSEPPWSGQFLGGILAMPLGRREIMVLPPATGDYGDPPGEGAVRREPTVAEIARAREAGAEWFLWEASGPDEIPEALEPFSAERYTHRVTEGSFFQLFRLGPPPPRHKARGAAVEARSRPGPAG